ncbi:hypothetical protein N658DRAFT_518433 [Parathielavia hyrcaniae]|uniref:Modin n=1 Tax=Parathielavia hyrcaniae TaxID=113614 RepID=A0AAN6SY59_9PEZI|nr:hypothetical protein N658DRAFT_518433 [Parathielavia hyrcaniae]
MSEKDLEKSTNTNGGDGDDENIINWVALVVSLVALLGTVAQVLQQYIASAAGYSNCGESVMGRWHESKKRKFRRTELRFEVQFETPVIFVCEPANDKGPIKGQSIYFVKGTDKSLEETRALLPKEEEAQTQALQDKRVHTADNERASWVILLSQLQSMERESQEWQVNNLSSGPPHTLSLVGFESHTLAVALQAKKRSWDTMPAGIKKPYATTAMCHLLEIAAMMGIYWKEFDRSRDRYRAEGNGYMLVGSNVPDLGVTFTLQICGKSRFQENRVIPVDEVKELCCGFVSTLFQEKNKDKRRIESPLEDAKDLSILQLGSTGEIAETMVLIECNTDTANYFRDDEAKHGHLFPVPFELLGMLGKTLHIRNTAFRMLPNPTPYHWDKNFFNLRRLVKEYYKKITDSESALLMVPQIQHLENDTNKLLDQFLNEGKLIEGKRTKTPESSMKLLNTLHDVLDNCDEYLRKSDRDLVRVVVREHFQEVLKLINDKSGADDTSDSKSTRTTEIKKATDIRKVTDIKKAQHFDELTAASPELRQQLFMDLYFSKVLDQVRTRAVASYKRRKETHYAPSVRAPSVHSRDPSIDSNNNLGEAKELESETKTVSLPATPSAASQAPSSSPLALPISPSPPLPQLRKHEASQSVPDVHVHRPELALPPHHSRQQLGVDDVTSKLDSEATAIWCTLVLRMLCWLLLHDFNKKDVQIPKSELLGSRLPVYIT